MGSTVKGTVDDAIDQCGVVFNIRDSIEEERARAEQSTDGQQKRMHAQKGIKIQMFSVVQLNVSAAGLHNLRRYFGLITFQAYLQSTEPDTMKSFESFETFVQNRPGS